MQDFEEWGKRQARRDWAQFFFRLLILLGFLAFFVWAIHKFVTL